MLVVQYRYGQCWVLAGVTITLLRALGVVCRPVTCYDAAHLCQKPGQIDLAFTPQGEMLDNATNDQLWSVINHTVCFEACTYGCTHWKSRLPHEHYPLTCAGCIMCGWKPG